jgi:hypothetical protein
MGQCVRPKVYASKSGRLGHRGSHPEIRARPRRASAGPPRGSAQRTGGQPNGASPPRASRVEPGARHASGAHHCATPARRRVDRHGLLDKYACAGVRSTSSRGAFLYGMSAEVFIDGNLDGVAGLCAAISELALGARLPRASSRRPAS